MNKAFKVELADFLNDLNQNKSFIFEEHNEIKIISNLTNTTDLKRENSSSGVGELYFKKIQ